MNIVDYVVNIYHAILEWWKQDKAYWRGKANELVDEYYDAVNDFNYAEKRWLEARKDVEKLEAKLDLVKTELKSVKAKLKAKKRV